MKILVIRTGAIGDVLLATPVIASISSKHRVPVDVYTTDMCSEMLVDNTHVSDIISGDRRFSDLGEIGSYDVVYNLQPEARSHLHKLDTTVVLGDTARPKEYPVDVHRVDYHANLCGLEAQERLVLARRDLTFLLEPDSLVIHIETGRVKMFSDAWLDELLRVIGPQTVYLTGLKRKYAVKETEATVHNLVGKTTLGELVQVIQQAEVVVTPDSASMHIAGALGVPTVALFGSTPMKVFGIRGSPVVNLKGGCITCWRNVCHEYPVECMETIPQKDVVKAIKILRSRRHQEKI